MSSSKKYSDSGFGPCKSRNGIVRWAASQISLLGQRAIPKKCSGFSELCRRMLPIAPGQWVWIFRVPSSHVRTNSSLSSCLTVQRYMTRIIIKKPSVDVCQSVRFIEACRIEEGDELMRRSTRLKSAYSYQSRFKCCSRPTIAGRIHRVKSDVFTSRFIGPNRVTASESILNENAGCGCVHAPMALLDFAPRNLLALIAQTHSRHAGGNIQAVLALDRHGLERNRFMKAAD
jgi:hypothetical protein